MSEFLHLLLAAFLVALNGFFVAAEFAIVKLRMTQAEEIARHSGVFGRVLRTVRGQLDAYLSACQLGITLASLGLGWIGEPAVADLLRPWLYALGGSEEWVHGVSFAVAFGLISFLHIVIGELAPKSIAIRRPVVTALWLATPLFVFYWMSYPFIWLLNRSAAVVLRVVGFDMDQDDDEAHSVEEIKDVLMASHRHGELGTQETEILSRALEFSELAVGDLMHPAGEMVTLDADAPFAEQLARMRQHRYSRYPVWQGSPENLIGVLHIKDLLAERADPSQPPDVRALLRELPRVGRDVPAMKLFRRFRRGYPHFAGVTSDEGAVIGFVTLDHLLEALHGRIRDEFHQTRDAWRKLPDGSYEGSGTYSVYSLERLLGIELDAEDVTSVGGLLMQKLDRVPVRGDRAQFAGFGVEVLAMKGPRVQRVRVTPLPAQA